MLDIFLLIEMNQVNESQDPERHRRLSKYEPIGEVRAGLLKYLIPNILQAEINPSELYLSPLYSNSFYSMHIPRNGESNSLRGYETKEGSLESMLDFVDQQVNNDRIIRIRRSDNPVNYQVYTR